MNDIQHVLAQSDVSDPIEAKRKRLIFRSWHRGTKEMDLIMGSFADEHVPNFNETELEQYDQVLFENDPDLYNWISGRETKPVEKENPILDLLIAHKIAT